MTQFDFGTIDPNTKSGTALASDLNSFRNALHSSHSGSTQPSYIVAGMMWVDSTSANFEIKLYDGAQSITVAVIDATNNVARVAVDSAETSFITSTTAAQIRHVIASTDIFTTRSTGIQFNLASPVIGDSNNNELVSFTTTASAVNQINIANSATTGAVELSAVGTDTNISIAITPKGTGGVGIGTTSPTEKLDVNGTANATNLTRAGSQVFSRDNILGTVTQTAGVPTGAIIESGSNANGEFVKFADGTMMCWNYALTAQSSTAATGSMFRTTAVSTFTFAVAFLVAPIVSGQADNSARLLAIELPTTTTVDFRQFSATTSSGSIGVRLKATGQWF